MGRRTCLVDTSPILLSTLPPMPSPVGGLIELLSSTHGHGAMPIGLRIVRPLVICGAIVAVLQRPTMSQEPNYAWSPSRTHSPPSLRSPRTSKAVVRPRPRARAGRQSVQSLFKARCQPVNRGQFVKAAAAPPLQGTRKSEEGGKEGRKKAKGALSV